MKQSLLALALVALLFSGCKPPTDGAPPPGAADAYPNRTITLIVPWAAGGGTDRLSRFMADQLQRELGKPVVVVNRTGGSGAVGHSAGSTARPDGYTITMGTFELSTMHWMGISPLTYQDFKPIIALNSDAAAIIVRADAPWNSLQELVAHIRANPGKLTMSGTSTGGAWDLARAGFQLAADLPVESVLWAPTQGSAPSLVELLGGHIDAVCCSIPEAASQIEAGQLRALAVMAPQRLTDQPEVPTVRECGIDWEAVGWRGLMVPKDTPDAIVEIIHQKVETIVKSDAFKDFMKKNGFDLTIRGPKPFEEFLARQDAQWHKVIEAAGYAKQ
jgi:tripartite-type tricarboxylate transporter receptor subunit TctC